MAKIMLELTDGHYVAADAITQVIALHDYDKVTVVTCDGVSHDFDVESDAHERAIALVDALQDIPSDHRRNMPSRRAPFFPDRSDA